MSEEHRRITASDFFRMANHAARDAILARRRGYAGSLFYAELQASARLFRFLGRETARITGDSTCPAAD